MTEQQLLDYLSRHEKANELTQRGIEQFNEGNLEAALLAFEQSHEINPNSMPNLLYDSLCRFSILQRKSKDMPNLMFIARQEMQADVQDIISKLELALACMRLIQFR